MAYYLLSLVVRRAPMLLLCLIGIVFAIIRWKRHPRVSLMTTLSLSIYLVEGFIFIGALFWVPSKLETPLIILDDFAYAAIITLLVAAVFTGRKREGNLY